MKLKYSFHPLNFIIICLLFALFGCTVPYETSPGMQKFPTQTSSRIPNIQMMTSSPTIAPSKTPTLTQTQQPTRTTRPTATLTWTPLPRLSPNEAKTFAFELLENNAGCRLPCWWGFIPGQTSWQSARRFLESFALQIYESGSSDESYFVAYLKFLVPEEIFSEAIEHVYIIRGGIIDGISIFNYDIVPDYSFLEVMSTYGAPDEVWIRTFSNEYQANLPFGVVLFYAQQGFMAEYYVQGSVNGDQIRGCPQLGKSPFLYLWSPNHNLSFLEVVKMFGIEYVEWPFKSLSKATNVSNETFFQVYIDPSNSTCLETPASLWPEQY